MEVVNHTLCSTLRSNMRYFCWDYYVVFDESYKQFYVNSVQLDVLGEILFIYETVVVLVRERNGHTP